MPQYNSQVAVPQEQPVLVRDVLQSVPSGLDEAGQALYLIGQELQQVKDARDGAAATAGYMDIVAETETELADADPRNTDFSAHFKSKQDKINRLTKGMSRGAKEKFQNRLTLWQKRDELNIAKGALDKSKALARSEVADNLELWASGSTPVTIEEAHDMLADNKFLSSQERKHAELMYVKLLEDRLLEQSKSNFEDALRVHAQEFGLEAALSKANEVGIEKGFGLTRNQAQDVMRGFERQAIANEQRVKEETEASQIQTENDLLVGIWNKTIQSKEVVKALENNLITSTAAKSMQNILRQPTREYSDPNAVRNVLDAIHAKNMTRREKLDVVTSNSDKLTPPDGQKYLERIYKETDSELSSWYNEATRIMEERIRDKNPISGQFTDNAQEIEGVAEGLLELDQKKIDGETQGKPLDHKDYLIQSIDTARRIKSEITARKVTDPLSKFEADLKKYGSAKPPKGLENIFDSFNQTERAYIAREMAKITNEAERKQMIDKIRAIHASSNQ